MSGSPGPCCSDFPEACPAEYNAGQNAPPPEPLTLPALPDGCVAPDKVIPVPTETYNFEESGKSCKGVCSSVMVDSDSSPVCYCDSSCLLTADCCPDFSDVCEIDPCIMAMVTPAAVPPPGSCTNACGLLVQIDQFNFCSCEPACIQAGTCCTDYLEQCPVPPSDYPAPKDGSCYQKCGQQSGLCHCDYQCLANGDCCSDYVKSCGTVAAFTSQTKLGLGSCRGKCNGAGIDCWCDDKCLSVGDCCWDYLIECK